MRVGLVVAKNAADGAWSYNDNSPPTDTINATASGASVAEVVAAIQLAARNSLIIRAPRNL